MKSSILLALVLIGFAAPSFAQQTAAPQTPTMPATAQPSPSAQPAAAPQPVPPVQQPATMQQPGMPAPEHGTASLANTELGTAALLVDRALTVLDRAANNKTGEVTLERGLLDEVRAELSQVKATLQAEKK